jgi:16S rRNA (cytosine1407-C5)-methyltransferase
LREVLQWQNAKQVEVLCGPGERLGKSHADCFDRVLVDVPCSGEGRFRLDKPKRIEKWNVQQIRRLASLQMQLLVAAIRCVKVGGRVVYSTCTFAPEENEGVLEHVLSKNSIDATVVPIPQSLVPPSSRPTLKEWQGTAFDQHLEGAIRMVPDETTTGFFVAVLERNS